MRVGKVWVCVHAIVMACWLMRPDYPNHLKPVLGGDTGTVFIDESYIHTALMKTAKHTSLLS